MWILLCILAVLGVFSIWLAYSDLVAGRAFLGWGVLACFAVVYAMFASAWLEDMGDAGGLFVAAIALALILMTQGPLLFETITQSFVPNSSSGLKLLKVHTEAEKKVIEDDLPGAITEYESIVAEDPDDLDAVYRLAEICCENQDYVKAAKAYHAIVTHGRDLGISQHCSALTRLSEIYANNLGDIEKARKCIRIIIKEYPETKYAGHASARLENM